MKPTFGLVPYTGIISGETSIDHTGPMSRDVMSNALLLQVLAGVDGLDDRQIAGTPFPDQVPNYPALLSAARDAGTLLHVPQNAGAAPTSTRKLRIGILKEGETPQGMDDRIVTCVRDAVKKFEDLGAEIVEVSVPGHSQVPMLALVQWYGHMVIFAGLCADISQGGLKLAPGTAHWYTANSHDRPRGEGASMEAREV